MTDLLEVGGSGENIVVWVSSGEQRLYWPGLPGTTESGPRLTGSRSRSNSSWETSNVELGTGEQLGTRCII